MKAELRKLNLSDTEFFNILYEWELNEPRKIDITCRLVNNSPVKETYIENLKYRIDNCEIEIYLLMLQKKSPLGKVMVFNFNTRNQSAEFGYYLPLENRGKGLGTSMVKLFLGNIFNKDSELNQIYATTSSNNYFSVRLLEKLGFKLDGRLREQYWIDNMKYDQLLYSMLKKERIMMSENLFVI